MRNEHEVKPQDDRHALASSQHSAFFFFPPDDIVTHDVIIVTLTPTSVRVLKVTASDLNFRAAYTLLVL